MLKEKDMYIDYKNSKRIDHQKRGNKSLKKSILAICLILLIFAFLGGGYLFLQRKLPITLSDISFKLNHKTDIDISHDMYDDSSEEISEKTSEDLDDKISEKISDLDDKISEDISKEISIKTKVETNHKINSSSAQKIIHNNGYKTSYNSYNVP